MPLLEDLLQKIFQQAQSRPDLGEKGKVATYAGRVVRPGDDVKSTLARQPQAEAETGATAQVSPGLMKDALKLAAINPAVWKHAPAEVKAMLTNLANRAPDMFEKYLKHPRQLYAHVQKAEDGSLGTLGTYKYPDKSLANRYPAGYNTMVIDPDEVASNTPLHELQHALSFDRVANTSPPDAATIGLLLREM